MSTAHLVEMIQDEFSLARSRVRAAFHCSRHTLGMFRVRPVDTSYKLRLQRKQCK